VLRETKIVLGITGGIAAYKAAELTRELVKRGADVRIVMTENASKFITPLTLETLSGNQVFSDTFAAGRDFEISHISLADFADIMIIAPATANVMGKIASGIADDLLTTAIMAANVPVLICPAMNNRMYANPLVKANIAKLAGNGYFFVEPGYGELACKSEGQGRLAEITDIVDEIQTILTPKDLAGEHVLVTAGPTREPFDPVRFITNYSSGKMGYALAIMAARRGAEVTLISGPSSLSVPRRVKFIPVTTALEMKDAVMKLHKKSTVIIKAAAVADYRPAAPSGSKIKKGDERLTVHLERNPDIIAELGRKKGKCILVGFSMETEDLIKNSRAKLLAKKMDMIVANDLNEKGAGFQSDTNAVVLIEADGQTERLPLMGKGEVANRILDKIKNIITARQR
jgi:phosphopantothenoylcysteine decarboxylase / phosphopantothenate---cysteine ligase